MSIFFCKKMAITLQNNNVNADQSDQLSITVSDTAGKSSALVIKSTGELQSNGKNVVCLVNGISADANGNITEHIINISNTSGNISLTANRVHKMTISGSTTFLLPAGSTDVFVQIKVMANVDGTPSINWGTNRFFNKKIPNITAGQYDFYFDYDAASNAWVAGAISKGIV